MGCFSETCIALFYSSSFCGPRTLLPAGCHSKLFQLHSHAQLLDPTLPVNAPVLVCAGLDSADIQCPAGQVITVTSALYGRLPGDGGQCNGFSPPCPQVNATDYYTALCGGRQNCTARAPPQCAVPDPCLALRSQPYTLMTYRCDEYSGGGDFGGMVVYDVKTNVPGDGTSCDFAWAASLAESMAKSLTSLNFDSQHHYVTGHPGCQVSQTADGGLVASYTLEIMVNGQVSEPRALPCFPLYHARSARRPCAYCTKSAPAAARPHGRLSCLAPLHDAPDVFRCRRP